MLTKLNRVYRTIIIASKELKKQYITHLIKRPLINRQKVKLKNKNLDALLQVAKKEYV